jgi:hypothetical protein
MNRKPFLFILGAEEKLYTRYIRNSYAFFYSISDGRDSRIAPVYLNKDIGITEYMTFCSVVYLTPMLVRGVF